MIAKRIIAFIIDIVILLFCWAAFLWPIVNKLNEIFPKILVDSKFANINWENFNWEQIHPIVVTGFIALMLIPIPVFFRTTPGKFLFGLKIIDIQADKHNLKMRILKRELLKIFVFFTALLGIGITLYLYLTSKITWYDNITNTDVDKKNRLSTTQENWRKFYKTNN